MLKSIIPPWVPRVSVKIFGLFLLFNLLLSCAFKVGPSGGPVDKTPPVVVATFPAPDSTGISVLPHVDILFSENVDRGSLKGQVWLLPRPAKPLQLKWKGKKKLKILMPDTLDKNQTYILTLGTGISDLRRNRMAEPFVLPFSTGPRIDRGEISGLVQAAKPQNVFIYAYPLPDSSGPAPLFKHRPRYYTQAGKDGNFRLKFLKPGRYRLFGLVDRGGDGLYSIQFDRIGLPAADVVLDSVRLIKEKINFTMILEDTTRPMLSRVTALDINKFDLTFTEPLLFSRLSNISVIDSVSGRKLRILAVEKDRKDGRKIHVYTENQETGSRYLGLIKGVRDSVGHSLRANSDRFKFSASVVPDTVRFKLITEIPAAGQQKVRYNAVIQLRFSVPVDSASLDSSFSVSMNDSIKVKGRWQFASLLNPEFKPDSALAKSTEFSVRLDLARIRSIFGAVLGDSVLQYSFKTINIDELGEIAGFIRVAGWNSSQAILKARALGGNKQRYRFIVPVNKPYLFPYLPEGSYRLMAVVDVNSNGRFDRGESTPFRFAEPFQFKPDTVKVRKRWTTDGTNFDFEK